MKKLLKTTVLGMSLATATFAGGMADDPLNYKVTLDALQIEHEDEKVFTWDTNAWVGYDLNKIYIYSEGEKVKDETAESENQIVWSNAIAPYWDIQYGLGYDKAEENSKKWAVIALQGMAPYFFETRTALLFAKDGNIGLRAEAEYSALITQKLSLEPSFSISAYTKDDEVMGTGKGLSNIGIAMNLKYEITREFAPYVGISYSKNFGSTNDMNSLSHSTIVTGVRIWF